MANFVYRPYKKVNQDEHKICDKHPLAYWGKDNKGNWYTRCVAGSRLNEECEELKEK